jgi:hypothetical protein
MCSGCSSLQEIPSMVVSGVNYCSFAWAECSGVNSGISAMYNKLSANTYNNTLNYSYTFHNCGSKSRTGSAELAIIPNGWKNF